MTDTLALCGFCDRPAIARGWCRAHYQRWWKYGDPLGKPTSKSQVKQDRPDTEWTAHLRECRQRVATLVARVQQPGAMEPGPCWEWPWARFHNGYGYGYRVPWTRTKVVSRQVWILLNGPVPEGHDVCHRCDNRACYRPSHLFTGTRLDNMQDMVRKGRSYSTANERSHVLKYTQEQIREVRRLRSEGLTYKEISRRVGVTANYAYRICAGISRVEVPS